MSESIRVIEEPSLADVIRSHMEVQRKAAEAAIAWRVIVNEGAGGETSEDRLKHLLDMETKAQEAVMHYQPTSEEEEIAKLLYLSALIVGQRRGLAKLSVAELDTTRH